jgi:hypothetical protein
MAGQSRRKPRRQRRIKGGSPQRINVRTTKETYARLVAGAEVAQLSIPKFLIDSTLRESRDGWSLREQRWWAERIDTVETRLIRVGANLNQMAAATNVTGELSTALAGLIAYYEETLRRHREVLDAIDPSDPSRQKPRS